MERVFCWWTFYGFVDFGGVTVCLSLMGLVVNGKVNGILVMDVNQAKYFPNFEIGNIFS